jgi:branched-chain amino acid transport system permease protein
MQGNSGEVILMTLVGGAGTFLGPVVGAGVVVTLQDVLSDKVGSWVTVIIGAVFVLCVLTFRKGIVGEFLAWRQRRALRASLQEQRTKPANRAVSSSAKAAQEA